MAAMASFRDPDGFVQLAEDRVLRFVHADAALRLQALLASEYFGAWVASGQVVRTWPLDDPEAATLLDSTAPAADSEGESRPTAVFGQERIPFISYPHEWCPEMLYAAAELTLDLQLDALQHGLMLKDATPWNVLFRGSRPVFVDVLSFVPRPVGSPYWPAYAQFVRTFILPLLLHRALGVDPRSVFLAQRDGLEPEDVYARLSWAGRLSPAALTCVSLPTWLGRSQRGRTAAPATEKPQPEDRARPLAAMLVRGLQRTLRRVRPPVRASRWSDYTDTNTYDAAATHAKETFVRDALTRWQPRRVLDLGCNTGHFSRLTAATGAAVVALDYDPVVVGRVFAAARQNATDVLPLAMNLAWPSPALGWDQREAASFSARAQGHFGVVLALAVVHHLAVTDGIPLPEIFSTLAALATRGAVVEFVPPTDPQFQRIVRNKEHLIARLQQPQFEQALAPWFAVLGQEPVPHTGRILYLLERRLA